MKKYESYIQSPFRSSGIEERSYITKSNEELWESSDGEKLYSVREVPKSKIQLHDSLQYTKLFTSSLPILMKLGGSSLKVLVYAICNIRPLAQSCFLNPPDVMVNCGFKSETTVKSSIEDLIEHEVLARKLGSSIEFWFNPNVFFNGNRVRAMQSK
jgi:hypothetical protein